MSEVKAREASLRRSGHGPRRGCEYKGRRKLGLGSGNQGVLVEEHGEI